MKNFPSKKKIQTILKPKKKKLIVNLNADGGIFDFKKVSNFAKNYLKTYYSQHPTNDELAVIEFLVRHYPKVKKNSRMIEIGCGPTIHHILPACEYISEIHMADYLEENLREIQLWKQKHKKAHNWNRFTELSLRHEGIESKIEDVLSRENKLRQKITKFLKCDLKKDFPLGKHRTYQVVGAFYCTEEVGTNQREWKKVMSRVAKLVSPGGHLFIASLRATKYYSASVLDGVRLNLPAAYLTEKDFYKVLPTLEFDMSQTVIETKKIRGQKEEGIHSVILVSALKYKK